MKKITLLSSMIFTILLVSFSSNAQIDLDCGDAFVDSGGVASDYSGGETITYTICPNSGIPGDVVFVDFSYFSTENNGATACYDGLTIYDGADITFPTINPPGGGTIWCWDRDDVIPGGTGDLQGMTMVSTDASGCLTFVFTSDGSVNRDGWEAAVTCGPPITCTEATVDSATVNADCVLGTFTVDVAISAIGDAVSYDDGSGPVAITGNFTAGPYNDGDSINITIIHSDTACNIDLGPFVSGCVPPAPDNDDCANAEPIACLDSIVANNETATDSDGNGSLDLWYSFTGTVVGDDVTLSLCGSDFDTTLTVYTGPCVDATQLIFNDDACGLQSELTFTSDGSSTYLIKVEGFNAAAVGNVVLDVSCASTTPPTNDACFDAIALDCLNNTDSGNTDLADDYDGNESPDVWYSFTGTVPGDDITISLCGSGFDTTLTVYSGPCDDASQIAFNDDACGAQSELTFTSNGIATYLIRVEGFSGATGDYDISVSCASASIPDNDTCATAEPIFCNETVSGDTSSAADDDGSGSQDVWYSYLDSAVGDNVTASLCGSGFDTTIAIFDACDGTQVAFSDDACGLQSEVSWVSDGLTTYLIRVEGFNAAALGAFDLAITCDSQMPPANDESLGAIELPLGKEMCEDEILGTNVFASTSVEIDNEASCSSSDPGGDVWFFVEINAQGDLTVETSAAAVNSLNDTVMEVYSGFGATLLEIGCDDDGGASFFSKVELTGLTPGETILIRVWDFGNNNEGDFNICAWSPATLSIDDNAFQGFKYYPNPVNDVLTLNSPRTIDNVQVFNMLGQRIMAFDSQNTIQDIDMSNLQTGAYFVHVNIDGITETIRIIKE